MTTPSMVDQEQRRRIGEDLDATLVVEAAAGTGKTTVLVNRVVSMLASGRARVDTIAAVTFTEAAAGELRLRLRAEIESRRGESPLLLEALRNLESARIGTIHSFCAELLRSYPLEAGVDPGFEIVGLDFGDGSAEQAFEKWFSERVHNPGPGLRRLMLRGQLRGSLRSAVQGAYDALREKRDFPAAWSTPEPWSDSGTESREQEIDRLVVRIDAFAEMVESASWLGDFMAQDLWPIVRLRDARRVRERSHARDYDQVEAELGSLRNAFLGERKGRGDQYSSRYSRSEVQAAREQIGGLLTAFLQRADADLAARLQVEIGEAVELYLARLSEEGRLDHHDLLVRCLDLLRACPEIRRELRARLSHIFIDEFQDTDPIQLDILFQLGSEGEGESFESMTPVPGKLFVVGDPKQAIYRFRRSDLRLYLAAKEHLTRHGGEVLHLTTSFRALPAIQAVVNASFSPVMTGGSDQADYVPLTPYRSGEAKQPSVIALSIPEPYGRSGRVTKGAVTESTPEAVAAFVQGLLSDDSPEPFQIQVEDNGARRRVRPEDICLLFKRLRGAWGGADPYIAALSKHGVSHVLMHSHSLQGREEVAALSVAMRAIEWPDDELAIYATLRGPLFAFEDGMLLTYKKRRGPLHPLVSRGEASPDPEQSEIERALDQIALWHRARNRRTVSETIEAILSGTRARVGFALWNDGAQVLSTIERMVDRARVFDARGGGAFQIFVKWLDRQARGTSDTAGPPPRSDESGVRLMTVHGAKGLEFPVVILCDPSDATSRPYPSRYMDAQVGLCAFAIGGCEPLELQTHREEVLAADYAEAQRLSYVAATRARDLLVIPAVGDEPFAGWLEVFSPAIYPEQSDYREPRARTASFGDDSVSVRPPKAKARGNDSVMPGEHWIKNGHAVTWWDPKTLTQKAGTSSGIRAQAILKREQASVDEERAFEVYWKERGVTLDRAAKPTFTSIAMTTLAEDLAPSQLAEVELHFSTDVVRERSRGARFGTLVHAILEVLPPNEEDREFEGLARFYGALLGASEIEIKDATAAVAAACEHDLMKRAFASEDCRREAQVLAHLPEKLGTSRIDATEVGDGVIDLVFREEGRWIVVDFKTDLVPGRINTKYAGQVSLYADAVQRATGEIAVPVLFGV